MHSVEELISLYRESLEVFFRSVEIASWDRWIEELRQCRGTLFLSGVGKSGLIAQKIAATMVSTGTMARFLAPADAQHGDLGAVRPGDYFLALSKSGETQELIDLIPHVTRRGAVPIAVVSHGQSRLAHCCAAVFVLPVGAEICPFGVAPTVSTAVQLIFGDVLAIALMKYRSFDLASFAANHPGGLLGRKISFRVADMMLKGEQLPLCHPNDRLLDVLHELSAKRCGCLLVVDNAAELQGIFTDGDLRRALQSKGASALELSIGALMTHSPKTISPDRLALEAIQEMESDPARPVAVLPVLQERRLVGLVRMHDIVQKF
jgi:arabinose-5-phosphate isomerase